MSKVIEENFTLPIANGKMIYGILSRAENSNGKVIVQAHGLTGEMFEHMQIEAKEFFTSKGYDVIRFNFYGMEEDARILEETTVQIHANDLNTVCDHFRPNYKKLYCIGHSYGGTTLLLANPEAQAFSFWDATFFPLSMHWEDRKKLEGTPYYTCGWGTTFLINESMYDEVYTLDTKSLAKKITIPSHIVLAGNSNENKPRTALYDTLACEKELIDIEGAGHRFLEGDTLNTLLNSTLAWFDHH